MIMDVSIVVPKVNQISNNETDEKMEDEMENEANDVQRDLRMLHDHSKDQILGKTGTYLLLSSHYMC